MTHMLRLQNAMSDSDIQYSSFHLLIFIQTGVAYGHDRLDRLVMAILVRTSMTVCTLLHWSAS